MEVARRIDDLRRQVAAARARGRSIHFVPTMGALHEGHRSLIRAAGGADHFVVVSIFVNPTQFGPGEDFESYPRTTDADLQACQAEGADLVFLPSVEEVYPGELLTTVHVERLTSGLCGAHRPGHFDGVTTVVAKLLNMVQPDAAYFGQKDAQQATVVRRMVADLNLPIAIEICPTVREADGVAMSSRNRYLSPPEHQQARSLYEALQLGEGLIRRGERKVQPILRAMRAHLMAAGPCTIDYVEIVDAENLAPLEAIAGKVLVALAVRIGNARLIDNVVVDASAKAQ
jgi:pantoate--beta-alanine ligase